MKLLSIKKIVRLYKRGSVSVCGLRGHGKDMLTANVVLRRKLPYISNVDYGGQWIPLDLSALDTGNTVDAMLTGQLRRYVYPYDDGIDIYISDAGIYFPSQDFTYLNKRYAYMAQTQALLRHLGNCAMHVNSQALCRVWDKIREQSDQYIDCNMCKYFRRLRLVVQVVTVYDQYDAANMHVPPFPIPPPIFGGAAVRMQYKLQHANYLITHGHIRRYLLIYRNKSHYDTRFFKTLFESAPNGGDDRG